MAVKRSNCQCFAATRRRRFVVGISVTLVTIFGTAPLALASDGADTPIARSLGASCGSGDLAPASLDPCPLFKQAQALLSRLAPSSAENLHRIAEEFELDRSLRIQQSLFREDLIWQNRGYTKRQMDLMVFIAVAVSLERAVEEAADLRRSFEKGSDPKIKRRLESVMLYQSEALSLLDRLASGLENVRDYELRFYF